MREMLYRGYVSDETDEWVYGLLTPWNTIMQTKEHKGSKNCGVGCFSVEKNSIGEYTGRRDIDGIRIFENDIVFDIDEQEYYYVKYLDCEFILMSINNEYWKHLNVSSVKVIGNSFIIED